MTLDLRTGRSIWQLDQPAPAHPPLREDVVGDVLIVGAGVTGALIAHALIDAGFDVVMVDRRDVAAGSTTASTAIISYETDRSLPDLIDTFGTDAAARVYACGREAVERLARLNRALNADCGFALVETVYFARDRDGAERLRAEFEARRAHGFDAAFITESDFRGRFSFDALCAVVNPVSAVIDPVRLTRSLVRAAEPRGLRVFANTAVGQYERRGDESRLVTGAGHRIRCKHAVFASGYEAQQWLRQPTVKLKSSYAIASEPVPDLSGWHARATLWEAADNYLYLRLTPDHRIVAGGEDEDFVDEDKRDALLEQKARILEAKMRAMFPAIPFQLAAAWTGTFAETNDALPYIGPHPDYPGAQFALGYGGNGTTFALIASRIIPDLIQGRQNSDAKLFRFGR